MSAPSWITCPLDAFLIAFCRPSQSLTETVLPAACAANGMLANMLSTITSVNSMLKKRLFFIRPVLLFPVVGNVASSAFLETRGILADSTSYAPTFYQPMSTTCPPLDRRKPVKAAKSVV